MPGVVFTADLDTDLLKKAEVQQRFDDIEAAISSGFVENDVEPSSIELRHLTKHPVGMLRKEFGIPSRIDTTVIVTHPTWGNYRRIEPALLKFTLPHPWLENADGALAPVFNVTAYVHMNNVDYNSFYSDPPYPSSPLSHTGDRLRFAYSLNSGSTWTSVPESDRPAGQACGHTPGFFAAQQQPHPIYGTGHPHYPSSELWDGRVVLNASFGGGPNQKKFGPGGGVNEVWVTLLSNSSRYGDNNYINIRGWLEGNFRWADN